MLTWAAITSESSLQKDCCMKFPSYSVMFFLKIFIMPSPPGGHTNTIFAKFLPPSD